MNGMWYNGVVNRPHRWAVSEKECFCLEKQINTKEPQWNFKKHPDIECASIQNTLAMHATWNNGVVNWYLTVSKGQKGQLAGKLLH